ncbi:MAG: potassium-transporting ATPase subunit KdpC [Longimicrobiaceae bacterium]
MKNQLRPAIVMTLALMVITGLVYPGIVTGLAQALFPRQANGSMVSVNGRVVGSELIAQGFASPAYFHPRPSAAGSGYDATASGGTNKGPTDRKLADTLVAQAVDEAASQDGAVKGHVPADMATRSASGLDPHISPANAELQVARVAAARAADPARVRALVARHLEGRTFGLLGEPRVNVLLLNLDLDHELGAPRTAAPARP